MTYKAIIFFDAIEDDYNKGEIGNSFNTWDIELTADTKEELKEQIQEYTFNKWENIEHEDINEYKTASEYHTSYLTNEDNQGDATEQEIDDWKAGKLRLWAVHCHILVSEVIEKKAVLA